MTNFTVIMPTRNRPGLFEEALESVLMQRGAEFDIAIVMDGSAPEFDDAYALLEARARDVVPVQVIRLPRTPRGHGQSYAINRGAACGRGDYLCFLDDDDSWSDPSHLARAAASLETSGVDLYLADQDAYRGQVVFQPDGGVWIEALRQAPATLGQPDPQGARSVSSEVLMALSKHCHLNTTILRRSLFQAMGGMDEDIRYDCDRDFYLRAVDQAGEILYAGVTVSRHNIPDPSQTTNMSTATPVLARLLYQLKVFDKSALFARRSAVAAHARRHKAYALRHIATKLAEEGRIDLAAAYAREALGPLFTLKWFGYCVFLTVRAWLPRG